MKFENLFSQTTNFALKSVEELTGFKTTSVDSCQQYKNDEYAIKSPLTKQDRDALHKLREDNTLIVSKPNKG